MLAATPCAAAAGVAKKPAGICTVHSPPPGTSVRPRAAAGVAPELGVTAEDGVWAAPGVAKPAGASAASAAASAAASSSPGGPAARDSPAWNGWRIRSCCYGRVRQLTIVNQKGCLRRGVQLVWRLGCPRGSYASLKKDL